MASLLSRATVYPRSRIFRAGIAVRFIERDLVTDALLALDDHRVLIAVWDGSPMEIQPDASRLTLLQLIGRALPGSPRVRAAIAEEQTRLAQEEANRIRARKKDPVEPLWPDCVPGPAEGEFVFYEEQPVPIEAPPPHVPPGVTTEGGVRVTLHAYVDPEGRVCYARVIHGKPPFDGYAVEAVRRWVFKPARNNGKPLGVWVEIPFQF